MPKMTGISAIKEIKSRFSETKILALTIHKSEEYILEAFKSGANGYCLKGSTHKELVTAIKNVLSGKIYLSPEISETVLQGYLEGKKPLNPHPLGIRPLSVNATSSNSSAKDIKIRKSRITFASASKRSKNIDPT